MAKKRYKNLYNVSYRNRRMNSKLAIMLDATGVGTGWLAKQLGTSSVYARQLVSRAVRKLKHFLLNR